VSGPPPPVEPTPPVEPAGPRRAPSVVWHPGAERAARLAAIGSPGGATIWLTGLSASGKSTVAVEVERLLLAEGRPCYLLDGDNLRHGLNDDLGFDRASREENVRRVGEVARLFADAGVVALAPIISPYADGRARARAAHESAGLAFVEVFVDTPLAECERRDPKGLYAEARSGRLRGFTGIDDPYEAPTAPDLRIEPTVDVATAAASVVALLHRLTVPDGPSSG
jgi:bifunctional enzyme CysN/CysC